MITDADIKNLKKEFATKDDLVSFKDVILHELQGIRTDMDILTGYKDEIEDHDVRITHLEKHLHITPVA
jgi:predicted CopG family antitoxin